YRELFARRPELAQGEIILNVSNELRLAKRVEDEERFYRETVKSASQLGQIAGAMDLAAGRGDVTSLIPLWERFDRLQTGRANAAYATVSYIFSPGPAICRGLSACAERKDYAQLLKLVDFTLEAARQKNSQQSPGAASRARRWRINALFGSGSQLRYQIWI